MTYLSEREGKAFPRREHMVSVGGAEPFSALVPLYEGKNLTSSTSVDEVADMVSRAKGSDGACIDYVKGIAGKLKELNIKDPAVDELLAALDRRGHLSQR